MPLAMILDANAPPGLAVARSLHRAGWEVAAPEGTITAHSPVCGESFPLVEPTDDADRFVETVGAALQRFRPALVAPAEDVTLELLYETEGLLDGAAILGGDRRCAAFAVNKARTLELAEEAGFPIPETATPETADAAGAAAREIGFPCAVKTRRSYARQGRAYHKARHTVVRSAREAQDAFARYVGRGFEPPFVQEWVEGTSIGVAQVHHEGRLLGWGARLAYLQYPVAGGMAIRRLTVGDDTPGVRDAIELLQALEFEGMGDVQYHIAADGRPRLMEIGARVYGWLPLTVAAGADLPRLRAESLEGVVPDEPEVARPGIEMRWLPGEILRVLEAFDPRAVMPPGKSRLDVLRDAWPPWRPGVQFDSMGLLERLEPLAARVSGRGRGPAARPRAGARARSGQPRA